MTPSSSMVASAGGIPPEKAQPGPLTEAGGPALAAGHPGENLQAKRAAHPLLGGFTRVCAGLSRASLVAAVLLLLAVVVCVQWQVIGRYVFNDTPTWAEALAMLLVLYMTSLGVAVGVRDAGHIGLESLVVLLPEKMRLKLEVLIHALVGTFGFLMAKAGWLWATLKWNERKPMLGVPEGADYVPLVIAGALIVLFSAEHIIALLRGTDVEPAWN